MTELTNFLFGQGQQFPTWGLINHKLAAKNVGIIIIINHKSGALHVAYDILAYGTALKVKKLFLPAVVLLKSNQLQNTAHF